MKKDFNWQVSEQNSKIGKIDKIDILINNGGVSTRGLFEDSNMNTMQYVMNVNLLSNIALTKLI